MHGGVLSPKLGQIKVISKTGLYLQTTERWPIGEVVSLTLKKEDAWAFDSEFQVEVQARVASHGEDGVGLGFVLPRGLQSGLWEHVVENADAAKETQDDRFVFRMVRAILFLCRICASDAEEPIKVLTEELNEERTRRMLELVLTAEKMRASEPDADGMHADPYIVAGILKESSWERDDLKLQLWAGLLSTLCTKDGKDKSSTEFVELFVKLTTNQVRILIEGCRRASKQPSGHNGGVATPTVISSQEMIRVSRLHDLGRCAMELTYLHNYGLIEGNLEFSTFLPTMSFDIIPTPLGMRLYKACRGHMLAHAGVSS
jgi:hypothetical protein